MVLLDNTACYSQREQDVINTLGSNIEKGLNLDQVRDYQQRHGFNRLTEKAGKSALRRFLSQFHQPLVYILLLAATVTLLLGEYVDASVITAVVLINAIVGYLQEDRALKALAALSRIMVAEAKVIREGKTFELPATELVPGDIVLLLSGDKVPADIRLLHAHDLRIDESALTGESVPVSKQAGTVKAETVLAERCNMAYASTLVTYGSCKALVTATGDHTEIGRISTLIASVEELQTPLTRKISRFSGMLLYVILGLSVLTFAAGMMQNMPLTDTFLAAVALAVAAIPEGLPAAFTIILAIGVARMARKGAIIRKLPAVETLGSTTIVCSDKTGTLTKNQMTVQTVIAAGKLYQLTGAGYAPSGDIQDSEGNTATVNPALQECLLAGLLCNDSLLVQENGIWTIDGDPTEGALIVAARKAGLSEEHYIESAPRLSSIPFESDYKYMATLHRVNGREQPVVYIKGAVETLLSKCTSALTADGTVDSHFDAGSVKEDMQRLASQGMRVLAFARTTVPATTCEITHQDINSSLTFLGLQGMLDPPREEAIHAISVCHKAGIRVAMITGDHAITAAAIATALGLDQGDASVLTGEQIATLDAGALTAAVHKHNVYARVSPEQKLRLVQALQQQDHVVAMTGDGVNDAPALKQADIGVAMGLGGTEVAKEAGDMVLTDDNFATIELAVEEGRCVFDNLTKFIVWTMPTNMGEALIVLTAIFAGLTLPVLPAHILWINMTTALMLGLMLAFERKEPAIMQRPPRDPNTPILTGGLMLRIVMVALIMLGVAFFMFTWETRHGHSIEAARTTVVNVIVMCELFYLLNCRSLDHSMLSMGVFSNRWLLAGVAGMLLLQLAFTYLPIFNQLFHTVPIGWKSWAGALTAGVLVYTLVGFEKWLRHKVHFIPLATSR